MPAGRPSTYPESDKERKELCARVIALGAEGKSECQISAAIDQPRTTMRSWADQHPEFSSALTRAKELEQAWWENEAQSNLKDKDFNANLWNKSMSARFRSEYGDKVQHLGDKDNPIAHEHKHDVEFYIVDPRSDADGSTD